MSVLLICDLCGLRQPLDPGDQSGHIGKGKGWIWIKDSSFNHQHIILPEVICLDCDTAIKVSRHNAELVTREQRKSRAS